jgi:hypothetical protein
VKADQNWFARIFVRDGNEEKMVCVFKSGNPITYFECQADVFDAIAKLIVTGTVITEEPSFQCVKDKDRDYFAAMMEKQA